MIAATLFSGIGAPEAAMPHWRWAWCAEIEKFPAAVLTARHPESVNLGDVSADDFADRAAAIARPDVLVFGSPCQSFSVAGKRLGMDDPRGNLAIVALGLVGRLRPRWFVFENVPGLFSSYSGSEHAERAVREGPIGGRMDGEESRDFAAFLSRVRELGYFGCWRVYDAQYFGVAQRRRRVFFVGYLGDWRRAAAVLFEPEGMCWNPPPRRQAGQFLAPTISARTKGGGGLGTDFDLDGGLISHALLASENDKHDETRQTYIPQIARCVATREGSSQDYESTTVVAVHAIQAGATAELGGEVATALRASSGGGDKPHVLTSAVRRLTPRECERLQGFPDDYTLIDYRNKPAADGPRYKALGNTMNRAVMCWILTRLETVDGLKMGVENV